ncbi:MAG TPA: ribosome-associated translation inhibitor RaiA [Longimicrobiales bacterium]|nr:ribosome-associated translation inhibitor RaiA [Longimicrobiales bacterium]
MEITINARHCSVPDSLRNQAAQRLGRLERLDRRITAATLVFDGAANDRRAEARIAVAGGPPLVGQGRAATLRAAMDGAISRLERQLKRRRERMIDRRTRRIPAARTDSTVP